MNRHSARKDVAGAGTDREGLERILGVTRELAEYARAHHFAHADELLTEVMAALFAPSPECTHRQLLAAEERALAAMRFVSETPEPED